MKFWKEFSEESRLLATSLLLLALVGAAVLIVALGSALWLIGQGKLLFFRNAALADWDGFASVMGFVSQTVMGAATLALAFVLSGVLVRKLEKQKQDQQRDRELTRLSENLVDTQFYIKVMYPAWEVALKWMDPELPKGPRYRWEVVAGELRLPLNYKRRTSGPTAAENNPRMHPHYQPYDVGSPENSEVINELSESLAFATWVRYWRNLVFLIDRDLIDRHHAVCLFREWYMWWAPFMVEFVAVVTALRERVKTEHGFATDEDAWSNGSIRGLARLHDYFGISSHCGHPDIHAFNAKVQDVVAQIEPFAFGAIETDKNVNVG